MAYVAQKNGGTASGNGGAVRKALSSHASATKSGKQTTANGVYAGGGKAKSSAGMAAASKTGGGSVFYTKTSK